MQRRKITNTLPRWLRDLQNIRRRQKWFLHSLSTSTAANMGLAVSEYAMGKTRLRSFPVALKVDISPICNLRCPFCVHGEGGVSPNGSGSVFKKDHRMSLERFSQLVEAVKGKTSAFSLYYLGDPFTHPNLLEMCRISVEAGIATHISTNFSFNFSDEKIDQIVSSGMSHLKVCFDGITQETYALTRSGGNAERVLSNIRRVVAARDRLGRGDMSIEAQLVVHEGNRAELSEVEALMAEIGVDEFTTHSAADYSMDELHPDNYQIEELLERSGIANCYWPWLFGTIKWNGDMIPCCSHRHSDQYDPTVEDQRAMGNIFDDGFEHVWNSSSYQTLRRLVRNPADYAGGTPAGETFCYGCKKVCNRRQRDLLSVAA